MRYLMLGLLVVATGAWAQTSSSTSDSAKSGEGPGDGAHLEMNVLGASSLPGLTGLVTTNGFNAPGVNPSAGVGYLMKQNLILATVGFLGYGPGTNVGFTITPTYRRYFSVLETGQVTPFAQAGVSFGILSPAYGPANYLIGIGGGAGAEWLFVKHLGLIADVLVLYVHQNTGSNIDAIGIAGNVGVTVHM